MQIADRCALISCNQIQSQSLYNWRSIGRSVSQSVSQSVLASSPSVTLNQILASVSYGVDVMGHLPWREDWSVFCTRPSTEIFYTWPSLESSLLDPLLKSFCSTLYWSLLVWVSQSVVQSDRPLPAVSMRRLCPILSVVVKSSGTYRKGVSDMIGWIADLSSSQWAGSWSSEWRVEERGDPKLLMRLFRAASRVMWFGFMYGPTFRRPSLSSSSGSMSWCGYDGQPSPVFIPVEAPF
jgi:hypothetical protein